MQHSESKVPQCSALKCIDDDVRLSLVAEFGMETTTNQIPSDLQSSMLGLSPLRFLLADDGSILDHIKCAPGAAGSWRRSLRWPSHPLFAARPPSDLRTVILLPWPLQPKPTRRREGHGGARAQGGDRIEALCAGDGVSLRAALDGVDAGLDLLHCAGAVCPAGLG